MGESRLKYNIDSVKLFDKEEEFQLYIDELAKAFEIVKTLEIDGKVFDNREDLEALLRNK
ncbi:MAG: hypothetical protein ACK504_02955 [Bacteroidota bacterium]